MSVRQADTYSVDTLTRLREFAADGTGVALVDDERAKVLDLCDDVARLVRRGPSYRWSVFGGVFSFFERAWSLGVRRSSRHRTLPALDEEARKDGGPRAFAGDYHTFDALSVRYGGLFRGSVIINYCLGALAVAVTVAAVLPQPRLIASSAETHLFAEFGHYATLLELACIACILAIYCRGRTLHADSAAERSQSEQRARSWHVAHRWRERWLEYRLLAERFRYIELMLEISSSSASAAPFYPPGGRSGHWYDEYFVWRAGSAQATAMSARRYRGQALALMLEQVKHHDMNNVRRGAIAERLERSAVALFFLSLGLCAIALVVELFTRRCPTCEWTVSFNENFRSILLFWALLVPTLSAAVHGILATTEYTKLAEASWETANHIASLVNSVETFEPADGPANPHALDPIRKAVTAFADAAINEASGWRATLHDKNVPLA